MKHIESQIEQLLSVALFASEDESRYVLNGVHVEVRGRQVCFVATDGRRLAVATSFDENSVEDWSTIIPSDPIERLAKVAGKSGGFHLEVDGAKITLTVENGLDTYQVRTRSIDGNYPNWRQVAPLGANEPVKTLGLAPELLLDFQKAAKMLKPDASMQFGLFGKDSAIQIQFSGVPNFYGVLMPVRDEECLAISAPGWLNLEFNKAVNS